MQLVKGSSGSKGRIFWRWGSESGLVIFGWGKGEERFRPYGGGGGRATSFLGTGLACRKIVKKHTSGYSKEGGHKGKAEKEEFLSGK